MRMPDYDAFFSAYVDFYNAALDGRPVIEELRGCYADYVVGASPGQVKGGENGTDYGKVLEQGFGFYRAVGMKRMVFHTADARETIAGHDMVRVGFTAEMEKDGAPLSADFEVVYVVQRRDGGPKIFAFMSGDELATFRELGLVDAEGKPA